MENSQSPIEQLRASVRQLWEELSPAERAVCQFLISASPDQILFSSAQELGTATGTSNATVVRTMQRLGFGGLPGLKRALAAEFSSTVAPDVRLQQRISHVGHDLSEIWARVFDEARERIDHCQRLWDPQAFQRAVEVLAGASAVLTYGIGASEPAARHLALKLGRRGHRARTGSATGFSLADDLLALGHGEAVVVFQPGRKLPEIDILVDRAHAVGARVVLVSDELGGTFADRVDAVLAAPHTPTGITAEPLCGIVVADALLLALDSLDETRAVEHSHQLTALREQLLGSRIR
ncbi:MurR/RpiR family transcriptional regulator [Nonomuraea muscovyensis]|uniref:DNA-binding MurR/RpiR family transcriptional regulator n=1 Tax=Nonomuraea muscovyensis TaxID=1124761 RepID=A0A7X0C8J7_9ACTN|nr:MurR/RpiR family transcriptional regulator [Nonomuraea muscovyensis]MBB6350078.1 DNA-binding MurR/RpiR family transcriptional regulator [Nonomuraea muscovyensis]MDF2707999.1 transcriptional regulator [Nonomuraea muscovyensis]